MPVKRVIVKDSLTEKIPLHKLELLQNIKYDDYKNLLIEAKKFKDEENTLRKFQLCNSFCNNFIEDTIRKYKYSNDTVKDKGGRMYAIGYSLQGISSVFRGFLMQGSTTDLDAKNCHCIILN
jgi:hypothetical protein